MSSKHKKNYIPFLFRLLHSTALLLLCIHPIQAQSLDELIASTWAKYNQVVSTPGGVPIELQPLHLQLFDPNPAVRIKAVQGLSLAGGPMAALLTIRAMDDSTEKVAAVRIEAAIGLGEVAGRQALEVLGVGVADPDQTVRMRVVESLRWAGTVFAVPYIALALNGDAQNGRPKDKVVGVRLEAVRMLRKIGTQFSVNPLADALTGPNQDKDITIRKAAADALGEIGKKERDVARYLGGAYTTEKDLSVKLEIIKSLGLVRDRAGLPYLEVAMKDRNTSLKMRATQVYGRVLGLQ
ncbi:MAG: HEAT repeat domain-containing protein [Candidatus Latescibacterota bacterium]